jgi:single-strand DNA-binding protein
MALNLNSVFLAGHLTRDPQVKTLANDRAVAEFGLAINRRYKTADGVPKEDSTFIDVEAWGRTAELVGQYLSKGSPCYLEGRLKLDSWQDKDGSKRSRLKVVADSVQFLGRPKNAEGGGDISNIANRSHIANDHGAAVPSGASIDQPPF